MDASSQQKVAGARVYTAAPMSVRRRAVLFSIVGAALVVAAYAAVRLLYRAIAAAWAGCSSAECAAIWTTPFLGWLTGVGLLAACVTLGFLQLRVPVRSQEGFSPTFGPVRWAWPVGLVAILLLAGWLRLDRLDLTHFRRDQALAAQLAAGMVEQGRIPLIGIPSSAGVPQMPGHIYLLAAAMLGRDPFLLVGEAVGLGLLAVLITALVGRRWFGSGVGLTAGAVVAVSFWSVYCSRVVWGQCVLPPVSILFLDAVLLLAVTRQPWGLVLGVFWAGLMMHLHLLSAVALVVLIPAGLVARDRLGWRHLLAAAGVFGLLMAPFLLCRGEAPAN